MVETFTHKLHLNKQLQDVSLGGAERLGSLRKVKGKVFYLYSVKVQFPRDVNHFL